MCLQHAAESLCAVSGDIANIPPTDAHTLVLGKYNNYQINLNFFIRLLKSKDQIFTASVVVHPDAESTVIFDLFFSVKIFKYYYNLK